MPIDSLRADPKQTENKLSWPTLKCAHCNYAAQGRIDQVGCSGAYANIVFFAHFIDLCLFIWIRCAHEKVVYAIYYS